MKIEQQAESASAKSKVGQQLGGVDGLKALDSLHFDDKLCRNDQITSIAALQDHPLELELNRDLPLEWDVTHIEFTAKAGGIGLFKKSGPD